MASNLRLAADYPDITWEDLHCIRSLMDEALPGAEVTGYGSRIEDLSLQDPSDRHVLAATIHVGADYIVTFNTRDFPASELESWDVAATGPDELVSGLFGQMPDRIIDVARAHRQSLTRPSESPEEDLQLLRGCGLEETGRLLKEHSGRI